MCRSLPNNYVTTEIGDTKGDGWRGEIVSTMCAFAFAYNADNAKGGDSTWRYQQATLETLEETCRNGQWSRERRTESKLIMYECIVQCIRVCTCYTYGPYVVCV